MLLIEATIETAVIICIICGIAHIVGVMAEKKANKEIEYGIEKVKIDG
ncbi:hypothetical protein [Metabacillus halosaccharovorans]|nr:hypothetical protein [Metabacillus halosaccharovorans]